MSNATDRTVMAFDLSVRFFIVLSLAVGGSAWGSTVGSPPSVVVNSQTSPDMNATEEWLMIPAGELRAVSRIEPWVGRRSTVLRESGGLLLNLDFISVNVAPEGDSPTDIAFSADGSIFVVSHRDSQNLVIFDADTRGVLQTIPVSGSPNSLGLTADGVYAVTANLFEDTASIVDLTLGLEVAVVPVGAMPGIVRITPDGTTAVVGNTLDSNLSVIDIASATELRRIPGADFWQQYSFGSFAFNYRFTSYEITPDSNTVIFPEFFSDQIGFFDLGTGTLSTIAAQPEPAVVDLSSDGTTAVVSHTTESLVSVIDVATQTITKTIPVGGSPTSLPPPIAINPEKTKAVVAVQNNVRVVDLLTDTVSGDLSTGFVKSLLTNFDGEYCMAGNHAGSLISFATESIVGNLLSTTTPDELAVSPVGPRAATLHIIRQEFTEVVNIDGGLGFLEGAVPTGPLPEGDKARDVAVSGDGARAVVINNHSHNATLIDLENEVITGVVPVGERPGGVAITPDGATAVVANLDSTFATVIDLAGATSSNVNISRRGSRVAISPDAQYAYVPVVANGDGVWRINLGTLSADGPRIPTGDMGGIGFVFDRSSGMTLSHDGATLVTCGSFTDDVSIIDTAAWVEVARVPVGEFPVRAIFSPADSMLYVSNRNDDSVSVVANASAGSSLIDTIPVGDSPFELAIDPMGAMLYVGNYDDRSISIIDTASHNVVDTIALPQTGGAGQPVGLHVSPDGSQLYVAANGADFHVIDTATRSIVATLNTGLAPAMLAFNDATACGHMPSPHGEDGLSIVCVTTEGLIFADGFESGDLSAWSASTKRAIIGRTHTRVN